MLIRHFLVTLFCVMSERTVKPPLRRLLFSQECSSDDSGLELKATHHNITVYPVYPPSVLPQTLTTFDINTGAP